MASTAECEHFFERFDPTASAVSDPGASFYAAFGLARGGAAQFFSPAVFAAGLRATLKGNFAGLPSGDVRMMPGAFLVSSGVVRWKFVAEDAGQHPDLERVARVALELARP